MVFKAQISKKEIKRIAREYKKELEKAGYAVKKIMLFGSYSKGTIHDWSDVDFLVISPNFDTKNDFDERVKINVIANKISPLIEAHPTTFEEFSQPESPWLIEAKKFSRILV